MSRVFCSIFIPLICSSDNDNVAFSRSNVFPSESDILLLLIVLLVSVCVSFNVTTVSSIACVTVSPVILVVIPVPPANCNVSEPRETVSEPVSDDILRSVDILDVVADEIRPFESTLITGISVDEP